MFQCCTVAERKAQFDCDDDIGIHIQNSLYGNVFHHASVRQHASIDLDWSEYTGDGHGGAHRLSKRAVAQHDAFAVEHVSRYAAERNRQVIKIGNAGFRKSDAIQQQSDALAGVVTVRPAQAMSQTEGSVDKKVAPILFSAVGELGIDRLGTEGLVPIYCFGKLLNLGG